MNKYFEIAFKEAKKAFNWKEVPVGAVIVKNNKVIAFAHNTRQRKYDVLGHAEVNCIKKATKRLKDWRLDDCDLYVTLEPCEMCKKIIQEARINNVFFILNRDYQHKYGKKTSFLQTNDCKNISNLYKNLLKQFFLELRK